MQNGNPGKERERKEEREERKKRKESNVMRLFKYVLPKHSDIEVEKLFSIKIYFKCCFKYDLLVVNYAVSLY